MKKFKLFFAACIAMLFMLQITNLHAQWAGAGTSANPWQISNPTDLATLAANVNGGTDYSGNYFVLTTSFALTSEWIPIGTNANRFKGTFDGKDNEISNLWINQSGMNHVGLFGYLDNATVINLNVKIATAGIIGDYNVGGLAGRMSGYTAVINCHVTAVTTASVTANYNVGGFVGVADGNTSIKTSSAKVDVLANGSDPNCTRAGGFVGFVQQTVDIRYCFAESNVTSTAVISSLIQNDAVGGFVGLAHGQNSAVKIRDCYAIGTVTVHINAKYAGGFVGYTTSNTGSVTIERCYTLSTVNAVNTANNVVGFGRLDHANDKAIGCYYCNSCNYYYPGSGVSYDVTGLSDDQMGGGYGFGAFDGDNVWVLESGWPTLIPKTWADVVNLYFKLEKGDCLTATDDGDFAIEITGSCLNVSKIGAPYLDFTGNKIIPKGLILRWNAELTEASGNSQGQRLIDLANCEGEFMMIGGYIESQGIAIGGGWKVTISGGKLLAKINVGSTHAILNRTAGCTFAMTGGIIEVEGTGTADGRAISMETNGNIILTGGKIIHKIANGAAIYANAGSMLEAKDNAVLFTYGMGIIGAGCVINSAAGFSTSNITADAIAIAWDKAAWVSSGSTPYLQGTSALSDVAHYPTTLTWDIKDGIGGISYEEGDNKGFLPLGVGVVEPSMPTFCGGDGTSSTPYVICNEAALKALADYVNAGGSTAGIYFKVVPTGGGDAIILNTTLDLTYGWKPIGTEANPFKGDFNGNNKVITGLWINRLFEEGIGLFGRIGYNTKIYNLGIEIDDANGGVRGDILVGGLAGEVWAATITNCYVKGEVSGNEYVGGFVGEIYTNTSYSETNGNAKVENCYYEGTVTGLGSFTYHHGHVGGFVGYVCGRNGNTTTISKCYADGIVNCIGASGLDPWLNSNATSNGGFVGSIGHTGAFIDNCYTLCNITETGTGGFTTAGFVGFVNTPIGGISNCYSAGKVTGTSTHVAGFAGATSVLPSALTNCYFDKTKNSTLDGIGDVPAVTSLELSASDMESLTNFTGFSNTIWDECYKTPSPTLMWEGKGFSGAPLSSLFSGLGTITNPFLINNEQDLANLATFVNTCGNTAGKYFKLMNNLDLSLTSYTTTPSDGNGWVPIGTSTNPFRGNFDGNNQIISGLFINRPADDFIGLFGYTDGAKIYDLGVEITSGGVSGGAGNISILSPYGGRGYIGGFVGWANQTKIENCYTKGGKVKGLMAYTGGFAGRIGDGSVIKGCYSVCEVEGTEYLGGFVGGITTSTNTVTIEKCYATKKVSSNGYGAIGYGHVGGFAGYAGGGGSTIACLITIDQCYAIGNVNVLSNSGGFIGSANSWVAINNCYAQGNVTETTASTAVGGFLGNTVITVSWPAPYPMIKYCYSTGKVTATTNAGGFAGAAADSHFDKCFFNSTDNSLDGLAIVPTATNISGKTKDQMKTRSTYPASWNFDDIWFICTNYPMFYWQDDYSLPLPLTFGPGPLMYDIYTIDELEELSEYVYNCGPTAGMTFNLMNDIDLADATGFCDDSWYPIGTANNPFKGTFNGNGKTILGLTIDRSSDNYLGLFGVVKNATIKDLDVKVVDIVGKNYVGGLVARAEGATTITNCSVTGGKITANGVAGGFIGNARDKTKIKNCFTTTNVDAKDYLDYWDESYAGGFVGSAQTDPETDGVFIEQCYATGSVIGKSLIGGFVGMARNNVKIRNCYAHGKVTAAENSYGNSTAGGFIGYTMSGPPYDDPLIYPEFAVLIEYCYSTGVVTGTGSHLAGFAGWNDHISNVIDKCYFSSTLSGQTEGATGHDGALCIIFNKDQTQLKQKGTYDDWDFDDIWHVCNNYPILQWQEEYTDPATLILGLSGSGVLGDEYLIYNASHLALISDHLYNCGSTAGMYFKVMDDIDLFNYPVTRLVGSGWTPIGTEFNPFQGNFNGNGHKAYNLEIYRPLEDFVGLFGSTKNATIYNFGVETGPFGVVGKIFVGIFSGDVTNNCTISDCYAKGKVKGNEYVGGFTSSAGYDNIKFERCYAKGTVTGTGDAIEWEHGQFGGFIGWIGTTNSVINECYAVSTVEGYGSIGGFMGQASTQTKINNCYAIANVSEVVHTPPITGLMMGGFIGFANGANVKLTNCYSASVVATGTGSVGGFSGHAHNFGQFADCYYDNTIESTKDPIGSMTVPPIANIEGLSTTIMHTPGLFTTHATAWDFTTIWDKCFPVHSYPSLIWEGKGFSGAPLSSATFSGGGAGTLTNPYVLKTGEDLEKLANFVNNCGNTTGKYFLLYNDVELGNDGTYTYPTGGWIPIGKDLANPFRGHFDGNKKTISNFWITRSTDDYIGLFGYTVGAEIKDLGIDIATTGVIGKTRVGGLVGRADNTTITKCYVTGGDVKAEFRVGGLAGCVYFGSKVKQCYADVDVFATGQESPVTGPNYGFCGGFVGYSFETTIDECYAKGNVSGQYAVGGFLGSGQDDLYVTNCYAWGDVIGGRAVGGFVGYTMSWPKFNHCYATGKAEIDLAKATYFAPDSEVGGFVGLADGVPMTPPYYDTFLDSYYNSDDNAVAGERPSGMEYADITGLTLAEMKQEGNYTGFDFGSIWYICNGYPIFQWQGAAATPTLLLSGTYPVYEINNENDLAILSKYVYDCGPTVGLTFNLTTDLNLANLTHPFCTTPAGWYPIGTATNPFMGTFNGNEHTIKGLKINRPTQDYIGLFGSVTDATITELYVEATTVKGNDRVGVFVGTTRGDTYIADCSAKGSVEGNSIIGVFSGYQVNGLIERCFAEGTVKANEASDECYAGGFTGGTRLGTIQECFAICNVTAAGGHVGGFAGLVHGDHVSALVENCYAMGNVIAGGAFVGGFVGYMIYDATVTNCYAVGTVSGGSFEGGFLGRADDVTCALNACFYNNETATGTSGSCAGGVCDITGKSEADMKKLTTFTAATWDIDELNDAPSTVWLICTGTTYPFFKWTPLSASSVAKLEIAGTYPTTLECMHAPYEFGVTSWARCYSGKQVLAYVTIDKAANLNYITVEYLETALTPPVWKPLPFSSLGVASFGPSGGFPFTDGFTSYFRVANKGNAPADIDIEFSIIITKYDDQTKVYAELIMPPVTVEQCITLEAEDVTLTVLMENVGVKITKNKALSGMYVPGLTAVVEITGDPRITTAEHSVLGTIAFTYNSVTNKTTATINNFTYTDIDLVMDVLKAERVGTYPYTITLYDGAIKIITSNVAPLTVNPLKLTAEDVTLVAQEEKAKVKVITGTEKDAFIPGIKAVVEIVGKPNITATHSILTFTFTYNSVTNITSAILNDFVYTDIELILETAKAMRLGTYPYTVTLYYNDLEVGKSNIGILTVICPTVKTDEVNVFTYGVVPLAGNCWFKQNLRATLYQNGGVIPFAKPYYHAPQFTESDNYVNDNYGLLYDYPSAFPLSGRATTEPLVCPEGWRIPTSEEWLSLNMYDAKDLMDPAKWLTNSFTNSLDFGAPGAGIYTSNIKRFENMLAYTAYWCSDAEKPGSPTCLGATLRYFCSKFEIKDINRNDAISIRCILDVDFGDE